MTRATTPLFLTFMITCTLCVTLANGHLGPGQCGHNRAIKRRQEYQDAGDAHAMRVIRQQRKLQLESGRGNRTMPGRNMQQESTKPLEIHLHYQLLESTSPALREYIVDKLMPAAAAVLRRAIRVKVPDPEIRLLPFCREAWYANDAYVSCKEYSTPQCIFADIPSEHLDEHQVCPTHANECQSVAAGEGVSADVIVYVTNEDPSSCGATLASAGACEFHLETKRPIAGNIILCAAHPDNDFESDLSTAVHELLHIFGFDMSMFQGEHFINSNGERLTREEILSTEFRNGRQVTSVVLPRVVASARDHLHCNTLTGAELEDDGGDGTAGSHWEQRLFEGELMDAVGGSNTHAGRHVLTKLTLSLLEDTGWYTIYYSTAGFNAWGYSGGCTFAYGTCSGQQPDGSYYCDINSETADEMCTADRVSTGICMGDSQGTYDGCSKVKEYSNGGCASPAVTRPPAGASINGWYKGPFSRCIQESAGFGRNGVRYRDNKVNTQCYEMRCMAGELWIVISGQSLLCPSGGFIELDDHPDLSFAEGSKLGPCPITAQLCGTGEYDQGSLLCDSDCSGHGTCVRGTCFCHIGWVGTTCSAPVCWKDSQCSGDMICHQSGECVSSIDGSFPDGSSWSATSTGVGPTSPPPRAAGFYEYTKWGACSQTCDGSSEGAQERTAICHGDCSALPTAEVHRVCISKACANACDSKPCGENNLCSAQDMGGLVVVTCLCTDGSTGEFCHLNSGACHVDNTGACCPVTQELSVIGECCSEDMELDASGLCCPSTKLDGCGVCHGNGVLMDSLGMCCPVATTDANGACCLGSEVDVCGVCAGQGTSCLGSFKFMCAVTVSGGATLGQISQSPTIITELQVVVTSALGIPSSRIQHIDVSVPNTTESRRQLQNANQTLDITVVLYQDTATQPIGNQDVLSTMQFAVEQATFSQMNVTNVWSSEAGYQALCGNGICETYEAIQGHRLYCAQDCSSTQGCPRAEDDAAVGTPGAECANRGTCVIETFTAACSCQPGHQGEACTECEFGFVPRGEQGTCTPTTSRFQKSSTLDTGIGAQMRRTLLIIGVSAAVLLLSGIVIAAWCCCARGGGQGTQVSGTIDDSMLQGSSARNSWVEDHF